MLWPTPARPSSDVARSPTADPRFKGVTGKLPERRLDVSLRVSMATHRLGKVAVAIVLAGVAGTASADLTSAGIFTGNVGMSVDGVGGNGTPTGQVQAVIPDGATILKAYLYSAGTPFPYYADSPTTLADYNGAGITLAGTAITNFDLLVGATSTEITLGQWFTARADVTGLIQTLTAGPDIGSFSWTINEGGLSNRIDGEVLAIAYSHPSQPVGSVVFLNGGQNTAGETSTVNFAGPLDMSSPTFAAQLGVGISFSCCGQLSKVDINGIDLTNFAGNLNDGATLEDGSLLTVGGIGDSPLNEAGYDDDDELYDLKPFLNQGDPAFTIFTENPTNDDNIFFASLYVTAQIRDVVPAIPEPETYALMLGGLGLLGVVARRRRSRR